MPLREVGGPIAADAVNGPRGVGFVFAVPEVDILILAPAPGDVQIYVSLVDFDYRSPMSLDRVAVDIRPLGIIRGRNACRELFVRVHLRLRSSGRCGRGGGQR